MRCVHLHNMSVSALSKHYREMERDVANIRL
jgi:hypothetical protein